MELIGNVIALTDVEFHVQIRYDVNEFYEWELLFKILSCACVCVCVFETKRVKKNIFLVRVCLQKKNVKRIFFLKKKRIFFMCVCVNANINVSQKYCTVNAPLQAVAHFAWIKQDMQKNCM